MKLRRTTLAGGIVWAAFAWIAVPDLHHGAWAYAMLALAVLVLVPMAFDLIETRTYGAQARVWMCKLRFVEFPAAVLLVWSCWRDPGVVSGALAAPWFIVCSLAALNGFVRFLTERVSRSMCDLCINAALIFLGVGGAWTLIDRLGFRPMGFPDFIVTLTAVHFHFAGLLLPLVAGLTLQRFPQSRIAWVAAMAVIIGVPAVAVGITTTQLGHGPNVEVFTGALLSMSGALVAGLQIRIALVSESTLFARLLFVVAGVSLLFGMSLAGIYACRSLMLPLPWLDVPWMRALHGTANALGFGLCGLFAWRAEPYLRADNSDPISSTTWLDVG